MLASVKADLLMQAIGLEPEPAGWKLGEAVGGEVGVWFTLNKEELERETMPALVALLKQRIEISRADANRQLDAAILGLDYFAKTGQIMKFDECKQQ